MAKITKKEQAKLEKEKRIQEALEKTRARLAYLNNLGLEKEVFITLSTLKKAFTDKVIAEHFPTPFSLSPNPNLSKSYQMENPESMMKMYRLADVIEKIRAGVKPRLKDTLKEEYRKVLHATFLDTDLSKKTDAKPSIRKI